MFQVWKMDHISVEVYHVKLQPQQTGHDWNLSLGRHLGYKSNIPNCFKIYTCITKVTEPTKLWPWPLAERPEFYMWHTVGIRWRFVPGILNPSMQNKLIDQTQKNLKVLICDLDLKERELGMQGTYPWTNWTIVPGFFSSYFKILPCIIKLLTDHKKASLSDLYHGERDLSYVRNLTFGLKGTVVQSYYKIFHAKQTYGHGKQRYQYVTLTLEQRDLGCGQDKPLR